MNKNRIGAWMVIGICCVAVIAETQVQEAESQNVLDGTAFVKMKLKADEGVALIEGETPEVEYLQGNVDVLLVAEDPVENVRIRADRIDFVYEKNADADGTEARKEPIMLEIAGNVRVESRGAKLSSDKAVVDLVKQVVTSEGNAVFVHEDGYTGEGVGLSYDLNSGKLEIQSFQSEIPFESPSRENQPN